MEHVAGASSASGTPAGGLAPQRRVAWCGRPMDTSRAADDVNASPPPPGGLADVDYLKSRGYNATQFLGMIAHSGSAVAVAKRLFSDPRHTSYGAVAAIPGHACRWQPGNCR